ncbi:MAG: nitroreductase family protein [Elusimicrobiota bacterium]|jgi:nitroreductase|nr:nitroreductase family protein [Elusimicrobiota bacterium]
METLKAIFKRRSIRKFADKKITDKQIKTLLEAAMMSPTAVNAQEWEFLVIRDKKQLIEITKIHPHAQMLKQADAAIIVCGNTSKEILPGYWIGDCGACSQNILLAATDIGLGSVWLGVQPNKKRVQDIRKLFKLPKHIMPFNVIALGYPAEKKKPENRYDDKKAHYEKW